MDTLRIHLGNSIQASLSGNQRPCKYMESKVWDTQTLMDIGEAAAGPVYQCCKCGPRPSIVIEVSVMFVLVLLSFTTRSGQILQSTA